METTDFFKALKLKKTIDISSVYTLYYHRFNPTFSFKGENHNFWEFVYVDSGNVTIEADGVKYILTPSQAFLHRPGGFHKIKSNNKVSNVVIITFDCSFEKLLDLSNRIIAINSAQKNSIRIIIEESNYIINNSTHTNKKRSIIPYANSQVIKNNIELLLIYCFRENSDEKIIQDTKVTKYQTNIVNSIIRILKENINNKITQEDISGMLGYSISYMSKVFKKITGMAPIKYLNDMRIDEAKKLIAEDTMSLKDISEKLGFDTVQYFSTQFKKSTNLTPSQYAASVKLTGLLNIF